MKRLCAFLILLVEFPLLLFPLLGAGQFTVPFAVRVPAAASGSISPMGTPSCAAAGGGYTTNHTFTYTAAATGDELFISISNDGANIATSSVAYNSASASTVISSNLTNGYSYVYEVTGISAGSHSGAFTTASATTPILCLIEFSGVNSTGSTSSTTSAGSPYSVALSITQTNGYILGFATNYTSVAQTPTATSGTIAGYKAGAYANIFGQYNTSASIGSVSLAGTLTSSVALGWNLVELKY